MVSSLVQVAHQELAHRLFISPEIKEELRLRGFGKGRDPTLIIVPFCENELSDRITEFSESS